jgi:hypothetical protein
MRMSSRWLMPLSSTKLPTIWLERIIKPCGQMIAFARARLDLVDPAGTNEARFPSAFSISVPKCCRYDTCATKHQPIKWAVRDREGEIEHQKQQQKKESRHRVPRLLSYLVEPNSINQPTNQSFIQSFTRTRSAHSVRTHLRLEQLHGGEVVGHVGEVAGEEAGDEAADGVA